MTVKKVLIALDFSERPEDLLAKALSRLNCKGATLYLMHVIPDISRISFYADAYQIWEEYRDKATKETAAKLADYAKSLSKHFSDIQPVVEVGDPSEMIAQTAERIGAEIIVVGNHCRHGINHLLHRNVAERIMRFAKKEIFSFYVSE